MIAALAGWLGVLVFVLVGLLALALEVDDELRPPKTPGFRWVLRSRGSWLLCLALAAVVAVVVVRFELYLN